MKKLLITAFAILGCSNGDNALCMTCGGNPLNSSGGSCDINSYRSKRIGNQVWMLENMNCNVAGSKCYGEGGQVIDYSDIHSEAYTTKTLSNAEIQANCDKYGRLYNWETAKKVCSNGWHLPSDDEWRELINYVEDDSDCRDCAGRLLKSTSGWNDYEERSGNGTDDYDFAALPGGKGGGKSGCGYFRAVGKYAWWWSRDGAWVDAEVGGSGWNTYYQEDGIFGDYDSKDCLWSVRCVQD